MEHAPHETLPTVVARLRTADVPRGDLQRREIVGVEAPANRGEDVTAPRRFVSRGVVASASAAAAIALATIAPAAPVGDSDKVRAGDGADAIEVRCLNIRYDEPRDGEHRWALRRDAVLSAIRSGEPDFVGLQEVLPHQRAWLDGVLGEGQPNWASIGRSRERATSSGEANPLLHRTDRWERLDGGTFWLSETPERIGSRSWDAACPRIATWGVYRRRVDPGVPDPDAFTALVVNTHFDHVSAEARRRGAATIVEFVEGRRKATPNLPVIVMGDLNTGPDAPPIATLVDAGFVDTHRAAGQGEAFGTFHGFRGDLATRGRPRIDFILADERFEVLDAGIEPSEREGLLLSDHRPVRARLRPKPPSAAPEARTPESRASPAAATP